ncbi:unnamed protein product [Camellia sinensis]
MDTYTRVGTQDDAGLVLSYAMWTLAIYDLLEKSLGYLELGEDLELQIVVELICIKEMANTEIQFENCNEGKSVTMDGNAHKPLKLDHGFRTRWRSRSWSSLPSKGQQQKTGPWAPISRGW